MVGAKCTIGQRWDDKQVYCFASEMTMASIVILSQRLLAPFSSAGFHTDLQTTFHLPGSEGAFTWLPLNSMPTRQKRMGSFHMLFDNALSGKFVRTPRLSVTSDIGHGNFVRFSGVLICYCFTMPSRGGRL